jgi:hypothetical protein
MNNAAANTLLGIGHRARPAHDCDGNASREQMGKNSDIECPHGWGRIKHPPGNEHRREDQRLRVCDARMSAVMIGIPERPFSGA